MAGFDFAFVAAPDQEELCRALLPTAQRHAHDLGLRLTYRREPGGFYVQLDGPLPIMHAFEAEVAAPIRAVGGAFPSLRDRRQRLAVASRMLRALRLRLADMTESLQEVADMMGDAGLHAVPHSIAFDAGRRTHLRRTLDTLTRTLALDIADRIEKRTVLEETHTTVEHVMRAYVGNRAGDLSFEGMVRAAADDGVLVVHPASSLSGG